MAPNMPRIHMIIVSIIPFTPCFIIHYLSRETGRVLRPVLLYRFTQNKHMQKPNTNAAAQAAISRNTIIVLRPVLRYQSPVDDSGSSFLKIASSSFFASVFVMAYRYSGSTLTSKSQFCDKYPATVVAAKWSS